LIENAREEVDHMNRLVGNLLQMTRLEAGVVQVVKQPGDIQDAVLTAIENLDKRVDGRRVKVDIPADIPLIPMDFVLIVQVLVNLIDNALKYSPPDQIIEIQVNAVGQEAFVQVCDRGESIPPEDLERIFEKFYRVHRPDHVSGTGLGLSISRGIIESHGGRIWAENRIGGGTVVTFTLPLEGENE
jgi:two-component system sensor histidine kinase KdpD